MSSEAGAIGATEAVVGELSPPVAHLASAFAASMLVGDGLELWRFLGRAVQRGDVFGDSSPASMLLAALGFLREIFGVFASDVDMVRFVDTSCPFAGKRFCVLSLRVNSDLCSSRVSRKKERHKKRK